MTGGELQPFVELPVKNELVVSNQKSQIPTDHEMSVFTVMAKSAVASNLYKGIGGESAVMMIMLAARELGIPPMQALNRGLNIIQGSVEISARMMNAMIRRAGHSITIVESTEIGCTLKGKRADNGDTASVSYTLAEAQKAGLVKAGGGWTKNPKDMCFARAMSRLARQLFSDVIGIGYVEGEIKAAECEVIISEEVPKEIEEVQEENVVELLQSYLSLFDKEDQFHALAYLTAIMKHFDWSKSKAIKEMLADKETMLKKFNTWKSKIKTKEES